MGGVLVGRGKGGAGEELGALDDMSVSIVVKASAPPVEGVQPRRPRPCSKASVGRAAFRWNSWQ